MVSHAHAVGFRTQEEFIGAIILSLQEGNITLKNNYGYHNLEVNDGIEILSITHNNTHITTKPYFKSRSPIPVTLSDIVTTGAAYDCEKRMTAYSVPDEIPIPFDYSYEEEIPLEIDTRKEYQLYLTAFAHTMKIYKNPDEFFKRIPVPPDKAKFLGTHEVTVSPNLYVQHTDKGPVILGGRVLDTKIITNSITLNQVRWSKIDNIIGNLEIVYPESELREKLSPGYYIFGECWLTGYIESLHMIEKEAIRPEKQHKTSYRTNEFDVAYM